MNVVQNSVNERDEMMSDKTFTVGERIGEPIPAGTVRVRSDGTSIGTCIDVLGKDGEWHHVRARAFEIKIDIDGLAYMKITPSDSIYEGLIAQDDVAPVDLAPTNPLRG
jgi:hypothetical protein